MIFTLNGGPGDGQKVEVGGKHEDGRTVRFVFLHEGKMFLYVCPSDDDFTMRQLFLTFIEPKNMVPPSHKDHKRASMEKVWGSEVADWAHDHNSGPWNDWREAVAKRKKPVPKKAKLASAKKYSTAHEWHNRGHEA